MLPSRGVVLKVPPLGTRYAPRSSRQYPNLRQRLSCHSNRSFGTSSRANNVLGLHPPSRVVPVGLALGSRIGATKVAALSFPLMGVGKQQLRNASWWNPLGYVPNPWSSSSNPSVSDVSGAGVPSQPRSSPTDVGQITETAGTSSASAATAAAKDAATSSADTATRQLSDNAASEVSKLSEQFTSPSTTDIDLSSFQENLLDLPEQIGFLKTLGMDFGWGPSSMMQWVIEHIHVYSGMPWWGTLTAVAILFRLSMFKFTLDGQEASIKLNKLMTHPRFKALNDEMKEGARVGDQVVMLKARQEMMALKRMSGASFRPILLSMINIPLGFGFFRVIRNMADIPVPAMETGGVLWFSNLTVADPYYVLPVLSAAGVIALMKATPTTPGSKSMQKMMFYIITPVVLIATLTMPAALQVFFTATGLMSFILNWLRMQPWFRESLGYEPLPPVANSSGAVASVLGGKTHISTATDGYQAPTLRGGTPSDPIVLSSAQSILKTSEVAKAAQEPPTKKSLLDKVGLGAAVSEAKSTFKEAVGTTETKLEEKRQTKEKERMVEYESRRTLEEEESRRARMEARKFRKR